MTTTAKARFDDLNNFVNQLRGGTAGPVEADQKTTQLKQAEGEEQGRLTGLQRDREGLASEVAKMQSAKADLAKKIAELEDARRDSGFLPGWLNNKKKKIDEQIRATQGEVETQDQRINAQQGKVKEQDGKVRAQEDVVAGTRFLQLRVDIAKEQFVGTGRKMGDRLETWQGKFAEVDAAAAHVMQKMQAGSTPSAATLDQLRTVVTQAVELARSIGRETTAETNVLRNFEANLRLFQPYADEAHEREALQGANSAVGQLDGEVKGEQSIASKLQELVYSLLRAELAATDPRFSANAAEIASLSGVQGSLSGVETAMNGLSRLVADYNEASRGVVGANQRVADLQHEIAHAENDRSRAEQQMMAQRALRMGVAASLQNAENLLNRAQAQLDGERQRYSGFESVLNQAQVTVNQARADRDSASQQQGAAASTLEQAQAALADAQNGSVSQSHTVSPGETLSGIAELYGVANWRDIQAANIDNYPGIADPTKLQIGWILTIPGGGPDPEAVSQAQRALLQARGDVAKADAAVERAQSSLGSAMQQLGSVQSQKAQAEAPLRQAESAREVARQQLEGVREQARGFEAIAAQFQRQVEQLELCLRDKKREVREVSDSVSRFTSAMESAERGAGSAVDSFNAALSRFSGQAGLRETWKLERLPGYAEAFDRTGITRAFERGFDREDAAWLSKFAETLGNNVVDRRQQVDQAVSDLRATNDQKLKARYDAVTGN